MRIYRKKMCLDNYLPYRYIHIMKYRIKKGLNLFLSLWVLTYSIVATGHFGHTHLYSRADVGFCTSECGNPDHYNLKPDCNGFPVNLTMGVDAQPSIFPPSSPEFQALNVCQSRSAHDGIHLTDQSRAPPLS